MPRNPKSAVRIAVDTGGTFTDCVWVEGGAVRMAKVFSMPADPSQAIAEGIKKCESEHQVTLLHGTTVGTNTLLQRTGARVALVTTAGFEDVIQIGRQARPKLYDFFFDPVMPLVDAELRFGVEERIGSQGEIVERLSPASLKSLAQEIRGKKAEAIAVCLLFSFANPVHERAVVKALAGLQVPLSVSHQILPEFREYERTSTVVINAYLQPVMQRYLHSLEKRAATIFVMQSSGGIAALKTAAREPVRTVLSGPAGGVVGATAMARRSGFKKIISFDMGGTSTDVALVDGEIRAGAQSQIAGLPIGVPILDIHTVGAGGGSLARFDAAGALRVGPQSAGADPGPICYGRGIQPTVTDANLILGRLRPDRFLGGEFLLDPERTHATVAQWLKKHKSLLTLEQFASGVIKVVNSTMEKAIRVVSIERGYDPRDFALVAFGGAGGLHACDLAAELSIPRVIIPAMPGALSAYGILVSDVVKDYSRTVLWQVKDKLPRGRLEGQFAELQRRATADLKAENWSGRAHYFRTVDVRYKGQGYELNLPYSPGLFQSFRLEHRRRYGYSYQERDLELVTLRLRATVKSTVIPWTGQPRRKALAMSSQVAINIGDKKRLSRIYDREELSPRKNYRGPAIVTEYSATTVVPAGARFQPDSAGNLVISL